MDTELKKIRLSKHETQAKIASTVGIDVKTYRRYENGKQIPPLDTAYRLARYYNLLIENIIPPESVLPELRKEGPS